MKLKSVEKLEGSKVCLEIEIEKSEYDAAVDTAYKQNVGKISVPGFRKGKAPRKMIERMYGENVFAEDAMNIAYPRAYESAVKESGVEPVEQAEIDITDFNDGCVNFKATVTVRPEVTLGEYKGLKAEKVKATVSDEDIDGEISRLAARNARLVSVTRAAKDGDTVIIDFEGFVDGTPFEGGKAEGHSLKIGS
ncbi:MAG: trigger factor, partial [Clostridia bacterium]